MGGVGVNEYSISVHTYILAHYAHGSSYDCIRVWEGLTGASGRRMVCV